MNLVICKDKLTCGAEAAKFGAEKIRQAIKTQGECRIILATGASQFEMLSALLKEEGIDWTRVIAFHMDEYVGLANDHPQSFGTYLREHVFAHLPFKAVNCLNGAAADPAAECARYGKLLADNPVDVVCLGIGENGHIAFNDPGVADFDDPAPVKLAELDNVCRMQQVHDGCFPTIDDVPTHAFTLTIPSLTNAKHLFCSVPASTKAEAVYRTCYEEITENCPATIMRKHAHAVMYVDPDSGVKLA